MIRDLFEDAVEAYRQCMVYLAGVSGRVGGEELELLSLAEFWDSVGKNRWRSLTLTSVTPVDEKFMRNLLKLSSVLYAMYSYVYTVVPVSAPDPVNVFTLTDVVNTVFAQGAASARTLLLHSTANAIMLPASFIASELNNIMAAISELYTMVRSAEAAGGVRESEVVASESA